MKFFPLKNGQGCKFNYSLDSCKAIFEANDSFEATGCILLGNEIVSWSSSLAMSSPFKRRDTENVSSAVQFQIIVQFYFIPFFSFWP